MAVKEEKIFYSMGEVAEMLDVSQPLLRFWEKKFDIIAPTKNQKGNRLFSPDDVRNLKTVYHLVKERGMTIAGAQKYLKANRLTIERDAEISECLQSLRALLVEVRAELGGEGRVVDVGITEVPVASVSVVEMPESDVLPVAGVSVAVDGKSVGGCEAELSFDDASDGGQLAAAAFLEQTLF